MKRNWIISLLALGCLVGCSEYPMKQNVGWITANSSLDSPSFKLCDGKEMRDVYGLKPQYGEGRKSVLAFFEAHPMRSVARLGASGYITIRFMVNCKGETGRFRVDVMDESLSEAHFEEALRRYLLGAVQLMGDWTAGALEGVSYDTYTFLTFKIEEGRVVDVLP